MSSALQGGFPPSELQNSLQAKLVYPDLCVEGIISHELNLLIIVYDITSCLPGWYFQRSASEPPHISGCGFTGTPRQGRDRVPLFMGFSIRQAWVTQPSPRYNSLVIGKFRDPGRDAQYPGPFYREPASSSSLRFAPSSTPATPSSNPRVPIATSPSHVRIQPSGPVGGFFCHRGGHCKASRSKVPDLENLSSASGARASHPHPQAP